VKNSMLSDCHFLLISNGFSKKMIELHKKNITAKANKGQMVLSSNLFNNLQRGLHRSESLVSQSGKKRERKEDEDLTQHVLSSITHVLVHETMTFEKLEDILPVSYYYDISMNRKQVPIVKIEWLSVCLRNRCVGEVEEFLVKREEGKKEEEEEDECKEEEADQTSYYLENWEASYFFRAAPLVSPNDDIVDALREIGEFYEVWKIISSFLSVKLNLVDQSWGYKPWI